MPPGRKPAHSRGEFVRAAIDYADEYGLGALTLRALGAAIGTSATAIYRYFPDKDALVVAMREDLLGRAFPTAAAFDGPADAIVTSALSFRQTARDHPCLSQIMSLAAVEGPQSGAAPRATVEALASLGLSGPSLVRAYRQLETFVVGACMFDFSGAPRHLVDRHARLGLFDDPDFADNLATLEDIDRVNEEAFESTLLLLVEAIAASAQGNASA